MSRLGARRAAAAVAAASIVAELLALPVAGPASAAYVTSILLLLGLREALAAAASAAAGLAASATGASSPLLLAALVALWAAGEAYVSRRGWEEYKLSPLRWASYAYLAAGLLSILPPAAGVVAYAARALEALGWGELALFGDAREHVD